MTNIQKFEQNLSLFSRFCPESVQKVRVAECTHLEFCRTDKGEENIRNINWTTSPYYYSQQGAIETLQASLDHYPLFSEDIIVIYGVGLGYHVEALKKWMQHDPRRLLVLIDDDPAVWRRFLESDQAEKVLTNTQVVLIDFKYPSYDQWNDFRNKFNWLISCSTVRRITCLPSDAYATNRPTECSLITTQFSHLFSSADNFTREMLAGKGDLFKNYFSNLLMIPHCRAISPQMNGKLADLPAIICGAGPSLGKQISQLNEFRDKAIIFAAGTAMNIVTRKGVRPHFGVSVDPHSIQESRIMSSVSYEIPQVLFPRFYRDATPYLHAPLIFYNLFGGSRCSTWFSEELVIPKEHFYTGISTSTVSTSLTAKYGSKLIILLGMDLAYIEGERYAMGVMRHPTKAPAPPPNPLIPEPRNVIRRNIKGDEIETKWLWILESEYYKTFVRLFPEISLINSTEEGLKIEEVSTIPLQEIAKRRLTRSYDIQNWIHAAIETSTDHHVTSEKVLNTLTKWMDSLKRCESYFQQEPTLRKTDEIIKEPAYEYSLRLISEKYDEITQPELNKFELFPEQYTSELKEKTLIDKERGRGEFLRPLIEVQIKALNDTIDKYHKQQLISKIAAPLFPSPEISDEGYSFKNQMLIIHDKNLGIDFSSDFIPTETLQNRYPNGAVEREMHYLNGELHGPSSFYSESGTLLARGWFLHGKRIGKSWQYYRNGSLYSLQRYFDGHPAGLHEYYYPDGNLKTRMNYLDGLLEGELLLFHSNGQMKKRQHFVKGMLEGSEEIWDEQGTLLVQAEYKNNLPTGISRVWHPNGQLAKEVVFYGDPQNFDITVWDEKGTLLHKKLYLPPSPFSGVNKLSEELQKNFEELTAKLENLKKIKPL